MPVRWSIVAAAFALLAIPTLASAHAGNDDPNVVRCARRTPLDALDFDFLWRKGASNQQEFMIAYVIYEANDDLCSGAARARHAALRKTSAQACRMGGA